MSFCDVFPFYSGCPTAGVTRWWAGRDNATLPEPTSSHANYLKTRRLPPVGCTLCWADYLFMTFRVLNSRASPSNRSRRYPQENKDIDSVAQPRKKPGNSNGNRI